MKDRFVFFGSDETARLGLEYLENVGLSPELVVGTKCDQAVEEEIRKLACEFAILISYGHIIRENILRLFPKGIINIHPSLLPKLRGPSPIKSAILEDQRETGVSVMLLDQELDHGPIIAQRKISLSPQVATDEELKKALFKEGASLLKEVLTDWINGKVLPKSQDHSLATYTKKFKASDAQIDSTCITGGADLLSVKEAERKVRALNQEPGTYTILTTLNSGGIKQEQRVKILAAVIVGDKLVPKFVQPAGKKAMSWEAFIRGNKLAT